MRTTLTLPTGDRLRTATERRYVVVDVRVPSVEYRTDDRSRAITRKRAAGSARIVMDTTTGEVVR